MGDKDKSFLNSTQWIGAIEISMCLQQLYGVTFIPINVNKYRYLVALCMFRQELNLQIKEENWHDTLKHMELQL